MDKILIGKRVRRQREVSNLTREEFAEKIEISPQFLAEIENGKKGMSAETLYKICQYGGASADYILLGQTNDGIKTPAVKMLGDIPSEYSAVIEDVLKSFLEAINIANK